MSDTDSTAAGQCLARLQRQIERTYEVAIPHAVADFVTRDDLGFGAAPDGQAARAAPEKLLVVEHADEQTLDLALYLSPAVLDDLGRDDPTDRLHDGNLDAFLTALEGVSHFVYLLWNVGHCRSVSLMELELQAEVDKFVAASALYASQRGGSVPPGLGGQLFDGQCFDQSLSEESLDRYEKANRYAGRYCRQLEVNFLSHRSRGGLVNELRRFYRLTRAQKLRHIEQGPHRLDY